MVVMETVILKSLNYGRIHGHIGYNGHYTLLSLHQWGIDWFMDPLDGLGARIVVFNAMLNNISVISCYGENHQPAVSN